MYTRRPHMYTDNIIIIIIIKSTCERIVRYRCTIRCVVHCCTTPPPSPHTHTPSDDYHKHSTTVCRRTVWGTIITHHCLRKWSSKFVISAEPIEWASECLQCHKLLGAFSIFKNKTIQDKLLENLWIKNTFRTTCFKQMFAFTSELRTTNKKSYLKPLWMYFWKHTDSHS